MVAVANLLMDFLIATLLTIITAATPLLYAALGELVVERAGVLNLGVEGMILLGAVSGFAMVLYSGSAGLAIGAAALGGAGLAGVFAVLVLVFRASQVAAGLALTIFGVGLSALLGQDLVGIAYGGLPKVAVPWLADIPLVGALVFEHDVLVYGSAAAAGGVFYFLRRTRAGLVVRAVGDSHAAAHAMGYSVVWIRCAAILFGGAMAGLAGGYLSLAYSPLWVENMSAGRGWIALALVVFATWRTGRVVLGAYLFGGITILQLHAQAAGVGIPAQVMSMLPYLATIVVLVLISRDANKIRLNSPACLGRVFHPPS